MTTVQTDSHVASNLDEASILRDILQTIATVSSPQCIQRLLQLACSLPHVAGAALVLFSEPHLIETAQFAVDDLPNPDDLKGFALYLPVGIHLNPPLPIDWQAVVTHRGWLLAQIRSQKNTTVGVLWLVFDQADIEVSPSIAAIVNGLTVITLHARAQARHEKITRNQSEFMRIVSHDLRSPLTSMQGFGSMLESGMVGELNEKQKYFVEKILAGVSQMTALVDNIQDAGRYDPENGFYEMQRAMCDVTGIVNKIISNHLVPADKELHVTSNIADDIPIIFADTNMLERAITNLVDNAIKYTPTGGSVTISVNRRNEHIVIAVKDTGLGISAENQKKLFERHVRIPREEHKKIKGSGLGLFIVRSAAQRHGGEAWVESVENVGSTFFISLPIQTPENQLSE